MKKLGAIVSLVLIVILLAAGPAFAEGQGGFELVKTYPGEGNKNASLDNFSVKLHFNKAVLNKENEGSNAKNITIKDAEGVELPIKLYYSTKEEGMVMVLFDQDSGKKINGEPIKIKEATAYTIEISEDFLSADGTPLGTSQKVNFTTINQSRNNTINMVMMVIMFGGMFFFSSKAMKKEQAKQEATEEKVNPYKKAKETGKSVEEIVAKDQKKKAKRASAEAKKAAAEAKFAYDDDEDSDYEEVNENKRVKGPRPISAGGSTYVTGRKAAAEEAALAAMRKGTTNPKGSKSKKNKR